MANGVMAAKLGVYEANVALEAARARVNTVVREAELAEARYAAAAATVAHSVGIPGGRFTENFTRIEEQQ